MKFLIWMKYSILVGCFISGKFEQEYFSWRSFVQSQQNQSPDLEAEIILSESRQNSRDTLTV